jgi:hypothetical protein
LALILGIRRERPAKVVGNQGLTPDVSHHEPRLVIVEATRENLRGVGIFADIVGHRRTCGFVRLVSRGGDNRKRESPRRLQRGGPLAPIRGGYRRAREISSRGGVLGAAVDHPGRSLAEQTRGGRDDAERFGNLECEIFRLRGESVGAKLDHRHGLTFRRLVGIGGIGAVEDTEEDGASGVDVHGASADVRLLGEFLLGD